MTSTLYRSGSVHVSGTPRPTALLVDDAAGEIVWTGTDEAASRLGHADAEVDLAGRLLTPAFVDAWARGADAGSVRAAAAAGFGALHVLDGRAAVDRGVTDDDQLEVVAYAPTEVTDVADGVLTEAYVDSTETGVQAVLVVRDARGLARALRAALDAAGTVGASRFVAARHRLHVAAGAGPDRTGGPTSGAASEPAVDGTGTGLLAELGLVAVLAAGQDLLPLRALAALGVPFTFGSGAPPEARPWAWVRDAAQGPHAVSVRAAFAAATRGGYRAGRADGAGQLRPGAPASFAVWEFEGELVVRSPDDRVAAWSTDPRAATPGLPDLVARPLPRCVRTVVRGRVVHDAGRYRT